MKRVLSLMLALFILLGTVGTNSAFAKSEVPEWAQAYYDYLVNDIYLQPTGEYSADFGYNFDYHCYLWDFDVDGIPELIIQNGYEPRALRANYAYTYTNGKVQYIGISPSEDYVFSDGSYPGLIGRYADSFTAMEANFYYYEKIGNNLSPTRILTEISFFEGDEIKTKEQDVTDNQELLKAYHNGIVFFNGPSCPVSSVGSGGFQQMSGYDLGEEGVAFYGIDWKNYSGGVTVSSLKDLYTCYKGILTAHKDEIQNYENAPYQSPKAGIFIHDILGDDFPELAFVTTSYSNPCLGYLHIWTVSNNQLLEVYNQIFDSQVAGGTRYYLFTVEGEKNLYAYDSFGDESWDYRYERFVYDEKTKDITRESILHHSKKCEYVKDSKNNYHPEYSDTFYSGNVIISEEQYNELLGKLRKRTTAVLMVGNCDTELPVDGRGMTYEEAMEYLKSRVQNPVCDKHIWTYAYGKGIFCKNCGKDYWFKFGRDNIGIKNGSFPVNSISAKGLSYLNPVHTISYLTAWNLEGIVAAFKPFGGQCFGMAKMNASFSNGMSVRDFGAETPYDLSKNEKICDAINIMFFSQTMVLNLGSDIIRSLGSQADQLREVVKKASQMDTPQCLPSIGFEGVKHQVNVIGMLDEETNPDFYLVLLNDSNCLTCPSILYVAKDYSSAYFVYVNENNEEVNWGEVGKILYYDENDSSNIDWVAPGLRTDWKNFYPVAIYGDTGKAFSLVPATWSAGKNDVLPVAAVKNAVSDSEEEFLANHIQFLFDEDATAQISCSNGGTAVLQNGELISSTIGSLEYTKLPDMGLVKLLMKSDCENYNCITEGQTLLSINHNGHAGNVNTESGATVTYTLDQSISVEPTVKNVECSVSFYENDIISGTDAIGATVSGKVQKNVTIDCGGEGVVVSGDNTDELAMSVLHFDDSLTSKEVVIPEGERAIELAVTDLGELKAVKAGEVKKTYLVKENGKESQGKSTLIFVWLICGIITSSCVLAFFVTAAAKNRKSALLIIAVVSIILALVITPIMKKKANKSQPEDKIPIAEETDNKNEAEICQHEWVDANCTEPKTCKLCGATLGNALGHSWMEATTEAPKTCERCGLMEGEKLPEPVNLLSLRSTDKYGKLYIHSQIAPSSPYDSNWKDITTDGHIPYATDSTGKSYESGFHLDGPDLGPYYMDFNLNGAYSTLFGTIAPSIDCKNDAGAAKYSKFIEIYLDGTLAYTSKQMTAIAVAEQVEINIQGVNSLRIQYAATDGSNELATFFDGYVQ